MRKLALIGIFLVVTVVGGAVLIGTVMWTRITDRYKGYETAEQFVEIPPGAPARRRSGAGSWTRGVVRDDLTVRAALLWSRQAQRLKAGEYRFERPVSAVDVIDEDRPWRRLHEALDLPRRLDDPGDGAAVCVAVASEWPRTLSVLQGTARS